MRKSRYPIELVVRRCECGTVCDKWRENFKAFEQWALANGYTEHLTIDRYPDTNEHYEPKNCRWATRRQQVENIEMIGRLRKVNWTPSLGQLTVTIGKKLHRLGKDEAEAEAEAEAEKQYRFLLSKHEPAEPVTSSPTFGDIADAWLDHVQATQDPQRFRLCKGQVNEFIAFLGRDILVKDLRAHHVENWIKSKTNLKSPGSKRLYKAMVLAALNWAASAKVRMIVENPIRGKLKLPEGDSRGGDAVWPQEVFDLVVANSNDRYADFLRAIAWTGAQPSTLKKIDAKHYNPHLKVWDVEEIYRGRTSKKKFVKQIWLSPEMIKMVARLNKEWPTGPIFRSVNGKPFPLDVNYLIMLKLRARMEKAGTPIPEGISLYGLRHSFAAFSSPNIPISLSIYER